MISISSPTYDVGGRIILNAFVSNLYSTQRRGSVTKTLDGGVAIYDLGFSDAGEILTASVNVTKQQAQVISYLIAYYSQLIVCVESGAFSCVVSCSFQNTKANLTFVIVEKLS